MDSTKPSLSFKAPNINSVWGNGAPPDETAELWRDAGEERQNDLETKEAEAVDGITPAVETSFYHKGAADNQRFNTVGFQRRTKQKVVTDFATLTKGASTGVKSRATLRQVLFNQGAVDKSPVPEERGQLEALKQTLEAFPVPDNLKWRWGKDGIGTTLESSWTHIVLSHLTMTKTEKHQQEALWEFVHTELAYINKLTVVEDFVIAALVHLHQHGFLTEVKPELLFSNLPSILSAHRLFWQEVMYPMLLKVRLTGNPFDPIALEVGCLQFHERFSSYLPYCWEEENTIEFTRREMENNPLFSAFIQWVETHPQSERMRLGDMQAKPHQRITKYPLLLKAVLSTTEDPHGESALKGMLASVNGFLESINDFLRLKDEELALSISAQRVEGYVVEGISEEIDKHVREICHFDLTRPIRGVGPGVVRKLLLEESLKVRGRKDSRLEVVALLFSDVLLMTKAQKKAERLKVVRPPLALDRTNCATLKDGCSFVLVEVSELGCAMNVYTFVTSTPESCSTWVSTIHQQQDTLRALRKAETNRQHQQREKLSHFKSTETMKDNRETINKPNELPGKATFVGNLIEESVPHSVTEILLSKPMETEFQSSNTGANIGTVRPNQRHADLRTQSNSLNKVTAGQSLNKKQAMGRDDLLEMTVIGEQDGSQLEEGEIGDEFRGIKERRVTWNHNRLSVSNLEQVALANGDTENSLRLSSNRPHSLLVDGYPEIDYPINQTSYLITSRRHSQGADLAYQSDLVRGALRRSTRKNFNPKSLEQQSKRDSRSSQAEEEEPLSDAWRFSRKLKSPRLRRRRPINSHPNVPASILRRGSTGSEKAWYAPPTNSSSNSDSDCSQKLKGHFASPDQLSDSHLVLKLGSLKENPGAFWNIAAERRSPESEAFSEPELPKATLFQKPHKRPKLKTQRSSSDPDIIIQGGDSHLLNPFYRSSITKTLPYSQEQELDPPAHPSPLEGLLERAKVRAKDWEGGKREGNGKTYELRPQNPPASPLFTTSSPSPSDGDKDTEWREVALMRSRALTVSEGWREVRVDADEEEKRGSPLFMDGVNVDWPGWCFDDEEVMDHLSPEGFVGAHEGLLEDITRSLTLRDFQRISVQEDGECSQV